MFNFFNSNVWIEIGEAIGNIGKQVKRRKSNPELVDQIFRRRLAQSTFELPLKSGEPAEPKNAVIDVEYRILDEKEAGQ